MYGLHDLHDPHDPQEWLLRLTRPEDPYLWAYVAIAAGYAVVGLALGGTLGSRLARLRKPGVRRSSR